MSHRSFVCIMIGSSYKVRHDQRRLVYGIWRHHSRVYREHYCAHSWIEIYHSSFATHTAITATHTAFTPCVSSVLSLALTMWPWHCSNQAHPEGAKALKKKVCSETEAHR